MPLLASQAVGVKGSGGLPSGPASGVGVPPLGGSSSVEENRLKAELQHAPPGWTKGPDDWG